MSATMKKTRKPNRVKSVWFGRGMHVPYRPYVYLHVQRGGHNSRFWRLDGDALILFSGFLEGVTPFGIFLDRLQECPHEALHSGNGAEVVAGIEWLRANVGLGEEPEIRGEVFTSAVGVRFTSNRK